MGEQPVLLERGDMVIYKGIDITHSRLPLAEEWHAQLFLHFNDINGPYKMTNAYDGKKIRWHQHAGSITSSDKKIRNGYAAQVSALRKIADSIEKLEKEDKKT